MTNQKPDGGPAFASHGTMGEVVHPGMSLRDWFAGMALQGLLSNPGNWTIDIAEFIAGAYKYADQMLAERDK